MFKRMSILVRRPSDDRAYFARRWEAHGALVSRLPSIRSYIQNHVEEEFAREGHPPAVRADGLVELQFDTPAAMQEAFASDAAKPLREDEPSFLGHGTGYAMAVASPIRTADDGSKLIFVVRLATDAAVDALASVTRALPGCVDVMRDDVVSIIPRLEMSEGPQEVDVFLHAYFDGVEAARRAGHALVEQGRSSAFDRGSCAYRVRTIKII